MLILFLFPTLSGCHNATDKKIMSEINRTKNNGSSLIVEPKVDLKKLDSPIVKEASEKRIDASIDKQYSTDKSNILKYLPSNYSRNGNSDYTKFIQKAIDSESKVILPNFPIAINFRGIELRSNMIIEFQQNSKLIMLPNNKEAYGMLNIRNKRNITILSPNLMGDRNAHLGKKGEWGMGINILSSSNISIQRPMISNCWGDAIYLGRDKQGAVSNQNIKIVGGFLSNNRRNGISIISARGLTISDITIANTNGTAPEAGIDLEPNDNVEELQDIVIENVQTQRNRRGILIALNHFAGNKRKNIDVKISNHTDKSSKFALGLALEPKLKVKNSPVEGNIHITSANWSGNEDPIQYYELRNNGIAVSIENLVLSKQKRSISDIRRLFLIEKKFSIYGK